MKRREIVPSVSVHREVIFSPGETKKTSAVWRGTGAKKQNGAEVDAASIYSRAGSSTATGSRRQQKLRKRVMDPGVPLEPVPPSLLPSPGSFPRSQARRAKTASDVENVEIEGRTRGYNSTDVTHSSTFYYVKARRKLSFPSDSRMHN